MPRRAKRPEEKVSRCTVRGCDFRTSEGWRIPIHKKLRHGMCVLTADRNGARCLECSAPLRSVRDMKMHHFVFRCH